MFVYFEDVVLVIGYGFFLVSCAWGLGRFGIIFGVLLGCRFFFLLIEVIRGSGRWVGK